MRTPALWRTTVRLGQSLQRCGWPSKYRHVLLVIKSASVAALFHGLAFSVLLCKGSDQLLSKADISVKLG